MSMSIDVTPPITATEPIPPKSTTVKTDRPRPHVCQTCTRSFARLEHLKRHERSHTKEKPFKCDVCERCFARRDLLLRHRQKLHGSFPQSPRARQNKRKSTSSAPTKTKRMSSSTASSQARQAAFNAVASGANAPSGLSMALPEGPIESPSSTSGSPPALNPSILRVQQKHNNNSNNNRPRTMSFSASSATSYSSQKEVEAWNANTQWHPTAPPQVGFSTPQLLPHGYSDSDSTPFEDFFQASDPLFINPQLLGQGHSPDGQLRQFHSQMHEFDHQWADKDFLSLESDDFSWLPGENAPSQQQQQHHHHSQQRKVSSPQDILNGTASESPLTLGGGTAASDNYHRNSNSGSSSIMSPPVNSGSEGGETNATTMSPDMSDVFGLSFDSKPPTQQQHLNADFNNMSEKTNSEDMWKLDQTMQPQGSHVITPQLRLHVLTTLSTPTPFSSNPPPHLPSTLDLQRYINSYLENFGKHMPFLHDTLEFNAENMPLALGMAAIGALYTFEHANSSSIFEISRCCIHVYLEGRRERKDGEHSTPLWLVQALILGVIYGLFNSEPMANEIAVAQANAVISLSKSAGLHLPPFQFVTVPGSHSTIEDKWRFFIQVQSRIRTMHVVHTISCLLATSYNVTTTLQNSDIKCGSPCDESLWTATSANGWWEIMQQKEMDGSLKDAVEGPNFASLLNKLISGQSLVDSKVPQFTLLSLVYAQHLDIHERKLRHDQEYSSQVNHDREKLWLEQQKGPVDASILAWETTWSLSPLSSLSPSSQYGPLMSDSIPLSLLAHVRTYIDLRKVKECFWKRDFEAMGAELDNIQVPILHENDKVFNGLTEAASYAADTISLWSKHSATWTLETSVSQTFIHTILSLFDCGVVVSEFLHRLEQKNVWTAEESMLVSRIRKIFYRVVEVVGHETDDGNILDVGNDVKRSSVLALQVVSKILCKSYIWPFALVMGKALQARAGQISRM